MVRTIAAASGEEAIRLTNERSTFSSSTATRVRKVNDEKPVPKSSTASCTPIDRKVASTSSMTSNSLITTVSLISRTSRCGGTWCRRSASAISPGSRGSSRLRADRFTETGTSKPIRAQSAATASALSSTYRVKVPSCSLFSTRRMKSAGPSQPRRGCCQRISASTPAGAPVARSTTG